MIYTIGHSNHPIDRFIALLQQHGIDAVGDVRSTPYSRFNPQFSKEKLQAALANAGIRYVFLGEELGARSKDPSCYDETGRVSYAKLACNGPLSAAWHRPAPDWACKTIASPSCARNASRSTVTGPSWFARVGEGRRPDHPHPDGRDARASSPCHGAVGHHLEARRDRPVPHDR